MAANATGEAQTGPLRLQFDRSVKLAFHGSSISSDGGLLLHHELDDALGLTDMAAGMFADPRTGKNGRHRLADLLRQSLFSRLAGYEDVNDADRLCRGPVMRQLVGGRAVKHGAASASAMGRFETEMLTQVANLTAIADLPGRRTAFGVLSGHPVGQPAGWKDEFRLAQRSRRRHDHRWESKRGMPVNHRL